MRASRLFLLLAVAVVTLSHRSDGQQARPVADQLRLAGVAPRGALVYAQANDLSQLMRTWLASPIRDQFYNSPSFKSFSESRVYLKFQDRRKDFENVIGFGLDESRLAELAGGASAIAIYDIGNLELVFITEVARARAIATAMFKQVPQFQERSANGISYYVRDVTTDNGNLQQQFCFAYYEGKLIVATTEGLMIRALANARQPGDDSLQPGVLATAGIAAGFAAHDITIWLDQAQLNRNLYFNGYWIHHNASSDLANIESGIIDVRITPQGISEQRWFKLAAPAAQTGALTPQQATALMRFAPADAQLVETRAQAGANEKLGDAVAKTLFGKLNYESAPPPGIPDRTRSTGSSGNRRERYRNLDTRFDRDVDDDQTTGSASRQGDTSQESGFAQSLAPILAAVSPTGYCEMARSRTGQGNPFVRFERALVIDTNASGAFDRSAFEKAITDELRSRFVVPGVDPQLAWQDEAGVRYVAQSLLEQGASYAVSGRYLILASSREFARDILRAGAAAATTEQIDGPVEFYGLVRVAAAKPVFDGLMTSLDGKTGRSAQSADQDESAEEVKFFSGNLSSLIAASSIREVRLRRETNGATMIERLVYSW